MREFRTGDYPHAVNPADSATAAAFAVELMTTNTQAGAILKLQKDGAEAAGGDLRAESMIQGARWYKVVSGAYPNRADADSLLVELRRQNVLEAGRGACRQATIRLSGRFACRRPRCRRWSRRTLIAAQPVYALRQANGTAWLLAGAYETLEQAVVYAESLRASGITPVLVYRKGRAF